MTRLRQDRPYCRRAGEDFCEGLDIPALKPRRVGVGDIRRQNILPLRGPREPFFRQVEQGNSGGVHGNKLAE